MSELDLDLVEKKLRSYEKLLEELIKNKKVGSGQNGIFQNHSADDADLERGCPIIG